MIENISDNEFRLLEKYALYLVVTCKIKDGKLDRQNDDSNQLIKLHNIFQGNVNEMMTRILLSFNNDVYSLANLLERLGLEDFSGSLDGLLRDSGLKP